jgi:plasmid stabilization system protein ParE
MPTVVWTPAAVADVERQYRYLEPRDPDAAKRAIQAVLRAGDSLEENPRRGTIIQQTQGLRKLQVPFGKYGFVLHYIILEQEVLILRVYHGRQNRST